MLTNISIHKQSAASTQRCWQVSLSAHKTLLPLHRDADEHVYADWEHYLGTEMMTRNSITCREPPLRRDDDKSLYSHVGRASAQRC